MQTHTLESQPKNNTVAVSTPSSLNYDEIVMRNAKRKADNGAQFSSVKGKASLLNCCIDDCRSQLGMDKRNEAGEKSQLPVDIFNSLKASLDGFWHTSAKDIIQRAMLEDAHLTIRTGVLMSRVSDKGEIARSKTDKITSVYKPKTHEHRLCDTFGLTAAKDRLDSMLDQIGKWSRTELEAQRRKIAVLEDALSAKQAEEVK